MTHPPDEHEVQVGKPSLPTSRPPVKPVPKVTCRECGKTMLRLTRTHLLNKHGMTIEDYRNKYGFAASRPQLEGVTHEWMTGGPKNTALNDETYHLIMEMAEKGYPKTTIAKTVGISYGTLNNWLNWGAPDSVDKDGNRIYKDMYYKFHQDFYEHEAKAEILAVDALRDAGRQDWRAAVEFLARRFPENWKPEAKSHIQIDGTVEHLQVRDLEVDRLLEDPETAAMACELLERLSQPDRNVIEGEVEDGETVEDADES